MDSNHRPSGYEPDELPLLHAASLPKMYHANAGVSNPRGYIVRRRGCRVLLIGGCGSARRSATSARSAAGAKGLRTKAAVLPISERSWLALIRITGTCASSG